MLVETILIVGGDGADSDRSAVAQGGVDGVFSGIDAHVLIYHLTTRCADVPKAVMSSAFASTLVRRLLG